MTEPAAYCREVEAYLCRKNGGHLIRIVGPAFDLVSGWEQRGIPLSIVCAGVDRFLVRQQGKSPQRRRPARIEFCEADVLDTFDTWRRAVGAPAMASNARYGEPGLQPWPAPAEAEASALQTGEPQSSSPRRGPSLASHIVRAATVLTQVRTEHSLGTTADEALDQIAAALDGLHGRAGAARGAARAAVLADLSELDRELLNAARASLSAEELTRLTTEAERELLPFRPRMEPQAYTRALNAALGVHLRAHRGLPTLRFP